MCYFYFLIKRKREAEDHRILIELMLLYQLRHVNVGSDDSKMIIVNHKDRSRQKSSKIGFALLNENPAQSTSELARELNVLIVYLLIFK